MIPFVGTFVGAAIAGVVTLAAGGATEVTGDRARQAGEARAGLVPNGTQARVNRATGAAGSRGCKGFKGSESLKVNVQGVRVIEVLERS